MSNDKLKVVRVTDPLEMQAVLNELDAPAAVGGNTFDGLLVRAEEMREWRKTKIGIISGICPGHG